MICLTYLHLHDVDDGCKCLSLDDGGIVRQTRDNGRLHEVTRSVQYLKIKIKRILIMIFIFNFIWNRWLIAV